MHKSEFGGITDHFIPKSKKKYCFAKPLFLGFFTLRGIKVGPEGIAFMSSYDQLKVQIPLKYKLEDHMRYFI